MPRLGPDILHRPLALPDFAAFEKAARWLTDGALSCLPHSLRNLGWRAQSGLYSYTRDGDLNADGVMEKSWTGATRRAPASGNVEGMPAAIMLDPKLVFVTHADLPLAARSTLEKTVALQMDELSPIPPEEAAFTVGRAKPRENRLHVDVAITWKNTLEAAKASLNGRPISAIGAVPSEGAGFRFVFVNGKTASTSLRKWLIAGAALWISALVALSAFAARQEKMLAALDQHQDTLRTELHALKTAKEDMALLQQFAPGSFSLAEASELTASTLDTLPDSAVVSDISMMGEQMTMSGLAPKQASGADDDLVRQASDYPGFDRFTLSAPLQNAKVAEAEND